MSVGHEPVATLATAAAVSVYLIPSECGRVMRARESVVRLAQTTEVVQRYVEVVFRHQKVVEAASSHVIRKWSAPRTRKLVTISSRSLVGARSIHRRQ